MAARDIVPVVSDRFEQTLALASPDVLREMIRGFAQKMMDAEVEVRCNAGYGEVTPERVGPRRHPGLHRRTRYATSNGTGCSSQTWTAAFRIPRKCTQSR